MAEIEIDLSKTPSDPVAAKGYQPLYELWKRNKDSFAEGRMLNESEFASWQRDVRRYLNSREIRFFDEPIADSDVKGSEWVRAKITGKLYKILLDRQGFHVTKESGGLR